jgi:hypothetical protein
MAEDSGLSCRRLGSLTREAISEACSDSLSINQEQGAADVLVPRLGGC